MTILPAQPFTAADTAPAPVCPYCTEAPEPLEQFYETKLFRVLVQKNSIADGHVVIIPKKHDPHFYSFDLDQLEEFAYLIKKVSFIAMRLTHAPGFSMVMNDGTAETANNTHLEIHIIPRQYSDPQFASIAEVVRAAVKELSPETITAHGTELKNLMQLPQA